MFYYLTFYLVVYECVGLLYIIMPHLCHFFQVMAVCAHENMSMIAVGFQNGTVIVIRGNITRDRMSRVKVVHEEKGDRVYVTGNVP